jgi:hypothetical protein
MSKQSKLRPKAIASWAITTWVITVLLTVVTWFYRAWDNLLTPRAAWERHQARTVVPARAARSAERVQEVHSL